MACAKLLALCLLVVIPHVINGESAADPESDAYGTYGIYGGYSGGAAVLRSYPAFRRPYYSPYAYRRPYGRYHSPARRYSYRALGPSPAPAPLPVARARIVEPYHAPAPIAQPLQPVPAVPVSHVQTYGGDDFVAVVPEPIAAPVHPNPVPAPAPHVIGTTGIHPVPSHPTSSQYHAQDEFGNVAYGYKNPNSAKQERRDAYGNVEGAYSYIDATGVPKHLSYVADDYGFRVTGTNLLPPPPPHAAH